MELFKRKYLVIVIFNYGLGFGIVVASGALLTELVHSVGYQKVSLINPLEVKCIND